MRKLLALTLVGLFTSGLYAQFNNNASWIWINGEKHLPNRPIIGETNVAAPANTPGGRKHAVIWQDQNNNTWLFGGFGYGGNLLGYLNDLWKYDPTTNQWTMISASIGVNFGGIYGAMGTADPVNRPGSRRGSLNWTDAQGNLYLLGGEGFDINVTQGRLNDMWKFSPQTNLWTWIGGSAQVNSTGVYGTMGVAGTNNIPGARNSGSVWKDNTNNVWIFGGEGFGTSATLGRLGDLWKFDPQVNQWTWMSGPSDINVTTTGPSCRTTGNTGWKDNSGHLYLLGGLTGTQIFGPTSTNPAGTYLSDLWRYDIATNSWALLKNSVANGIYGTQGVFSPTNQPGSRVYAISWTDAQGNFWLYGGRGLAASGPFTALNDLWKYQPSVNQWAWIKGDNTADNFYGIYGTQGVADPINKPDGRSGAVSWIDGAGKLWSFSGDIYTGAVQTFHNDVWNFDPSSNLFTWIKGDSAITVNAIYGSQGVANVDNRPGERRGSGSWSDNNGNLWLYGGSLTITTDGSGANFANDLWKYNIPSNQWTWMKGGPGFLNAVYGIKGTPDPNNRPDRKENPSTWTDASNNFWLFGGAAAPGNQNDLWKYDPSINQWTWVSGDNSNGSTNFNTGAVYGSMGVSSVTNKPGVRQTAASWVDNSGNFWIFGGSTGGAQININDLWKYNPVSNQWTWMNGGTTANQTGSYGSQGFASPTNQPGARNGSSTWKDNSGNLWLFGGNIASSFYNDLWKYDVSTNQWTWVKGAATLNGLTTFSILGVPGPDNTPGARGKATAWTDVNGNFWLMGGQGLGSFAVSGTMNDLWMFNVTTNQWTCVKGDGLIDESGVYGARGIGNLSNNPGSRYGAAGWKDGAGDFWLYGGFGFAEFGQDRLSDLWKIASPSSASLPLHFVEFKGRLLNNDGILNWKTENEVNTSSFIIERSTDGRNYTPVGTVGANNRSGIQQYNFTDPGIALLGSAVIYYRLKQIDADGKSTYSNIIALTIDKSFLVFFYPNPVVNTGNITVTLDRSETFQVKVINQAGALIKQMQWKLTGGSTSISIDMGALPAGAYYLDLSAETISKRISFVKQ